MWTGGRGSPPSQKEPETPPVPAGRARRGATPPTRPPVQEGLGEGCGEALPSRGPPLTSTPIHRASGPGGPGMQSLPHQAGAQAESSCPAAGVALGAHGEQPAGFPLLSGRRGPRAHHGPIAPARAHHLRRTFLSRAVLLQQVGRKQDRWTEICQAQAVRGSAHWALQDIACPWGPHPTGRWRGGRKLPDAGRAQRPPENTQCHTWGQPDKGHPGLGLPVLWDARAAPPAPSLT